MKTKSSKFNWLIDAILFSGFIFLFFLDLTGVGLHQWIGIIAGALALFHLITHWDWVEAVTKRLFGRTTGKARLYFVVDAAILVGFEAILFSGLMISTWFSLSLVNASSWINFHIIASIMTLALVVFKLAIHWRWIVKTAQRFLPEPSAPAVVPPKTQLAAVPVTARNDRRDFLKMMGFVGAAAALALLNVANSTAGGQTQDTSAQTQTGSSQTITASGTTSQLTTTALTCVGRCPKGRSCSYPGGCHQYTDSNGNGRCDYGECA